MIQKFQIHRRVRPMGWPVIAGRARLSTCKKVRKADETRLLVRREGGCRYSLLDRPLHSIPKCSVIAFSRDLLHYTAKQSQHLSTQTCKGSPATSSESCREMHNKKFDFHKS